MVLQDGFAPPEEIDGDNPHPPEEDEYWKTNTPQHTSMRVIVVFVYYKLEIILLNEHPQYRVLSISQPMRRDHYRLLFQYFPRFDQQFSVEATTHLKYLASQSSSMTMLFNYFVSLWRCITPIGGSYSCVEIRTRGKH